MGNEKHEYVIGNIYGILKLKKIYKNDKNHLTALVECVECGKEKTLNACGLYHEKRNKCKCQIVKHRASHSKLYTIYHNMKDRCYNPNNHAYKNYGQKGITICEEWLEDFLIFQMWANQNGYKEGLTIDRINSNEGYYPDNCRWITLSENVALANRENVRRKADKGRYYGISPEGDYYEFDNAAEFSRQHNLLGNCVRQVANGQKKTHKNWKFGFVCDKQENVK